MSEIALLDSINPAARQVFEAAGLEVSTFPKSFNEVQLAELVDGIQIIGIRSGPDIPASVLTASDTLQAIGCFGVGTDQIEMDVATERAVAVFNSLHENTRSVAEHVIGCTFGLLRRIPEHSRNLHNGIWSKTDEFSHEVREKTMGIIGYGAVGSQVSVMADSLGMNVLYFDPDPQIPRQGRAQRLDTMEEVLATADVITLHVPGGKRTDNMINAETISLMKHGSYLINTARGSVVDYEAVVVAIKSGQLNGIAADVFVDEPAKSGDPFDHVLRGVDQAILTPHIAGSTVEAQTDIGKKTALKLLDFLKTGNTATSVNLPRLALSALQSGVSRLLNIHSNTPGVQATLDGLVTEAGLNIARSFLETRGEIGYAAIDVEGTIPDDLLVAIQGLQQVHHARVITA